MRTLAHISDLHFGTEDAKIAEGLIEDLLRISPTLVVVSGDLTQRARRCQFLAAQQFLSRLPFPQLTVPGNHDVPLFDVFRRFLSPLHRYCQMIGPDLDPLYQDAEMTVLGLNTARSLTWKNGRISVEQMERIQATFKSVSPPALKILVTHHPFIPPPGDNEGSVQLVGRAQRSLKILDTCRVDLLLAGHLHHGYTGDVRTHYPATRHAIIAAQAGTAISRRVRQQANAYNLITLNSDRIDIAVRVWKQGAFEESITASYYRKGEEWGEAAIFG